MVADGGFRIAFGSCNDVNKTQALWGQVLAREPDQWIWGGDNVYGDWRPRSLRELAKVGWDEPERLRRGLYGIWFPATPDKLRRLYNKLKADPGYAEVVRRAGPVMGVWDDHDYGQNDRGSDYEFRRESQRAFLEFMDAPPEDERWSRDGIYDTRDLAGGAVRVVMLDNRFFRDAYSTAGGDILGEAQWTWLEGVLDDAGPEWTLLVSGVQVLPDSWVRTRAENWARLPAARDRLLRVLGKAKARGLVLLSGDVHFSEFLLGNCTCEGGAAFGLPEFTSSGMTHAWSTYPMPFPWFMDCAHRLLPFRYNVANKWFIDRSFGELDFEGLGTGASALTMRIIDAAGAVRHEQIWRQSDVKPAGSLGAACTCGPNQGPRATGAAAFAATASWAAASLLPLVALAALLFAFLSRACRRGGRNTTGPQRQQQRPKAE